MIIKLVLSSFSIIFSLIMLYITQVNYKKRLLNKISYLFWICIWTLIILASLRPEFVDSYFTENYDVDVFYILSVLSIISLVILYFFSLIKINILEKKINALISAESLKEILEKIKDK